MATIDLNNDIQLIENLLRDTSGKEIPAFEIFKDKEFQFCFIHKTSVDAILSEESGLDYNGKIQRLTELAEKTISLKVPEPGVAGV